MSGRVEGKSIVLVGGTSGIGRATAKLLAKEGANLIFAGRSADKGKAIEEEIRKEGGKALFIKTDATNFDDLKALSDAAMEKNGKIDVLINNAGILHEYNMVDMDPVKDFDDIFNTNVKSYFMMIKYVLPHMLKAGKGSIINTASVAAIVGAPFHGSYAASKGAVAQFTKTLAVELAKQGVRVNAVLPGLTTSGMVPVSGSFEAAVLPGVPMGRTAQPEELAPAFLFLASDESSYCTGTLLLVDGGLTSI